MKDFRKLTVWQEAHEIALRIYQLTQQFPPSEIYGLSSQLRRASSSIPANIAEGCGCDGDREFARFAQIAFRSASETEYHIILARDLGYMKSAEYEDINKQVTKVKQMLSNLLRKLKADSRKPMADSQFPTRSQT